MHIYKVCGMRLTYAAEQEIPYAAVKYFQEVMERIGGNFTETYKAVAAESYMERIGGNFTETYKAVAAESYDVAAKEISHHIVEYLVGDLGSNGKINGSHVEFEMARLELKERGFWLGDWLTNCKSYNVGDCLHGDSK